jgi:hypothetical protein
MAEQADQQEHREKGELPNNSQHSTLTTEGVHIVRLHIRKE